MALRTVVLAEPDPLVRMTLSEVLGGEGWKVVAAGPAPDVLERFRAKPGLAVVDLSPTHEAEGFCIGVRIRYGPQVPILGITRRREPQRLPGWLDKPLGPADILTVPFAISRLQELLGRLEALQERTRHLRATSEEAVAKLRAARGPVHREL